MPITNINQVIAKKGDPILPKWKLLVELVQRGFRFGRDVKLSILPGGGMLVSAVGEPYPWLHPWKVGFPDDDNTIQIRPGTVNGHVPFVNEKSRLGEVDKESGDTPGLKIKVGEEGERTWVLVGKNTNYTEDETTFANLKIGSATVLPEGMGTGGVIATNDGWALYPVAMFLWGADGLVDRVFQISYHNLNHVAHRVEGKKDRHFFFAA